MDQRIARVVLAETIGEILYAPLWWYTTGAAQAIDRFFTHLRMGNESLGFSIWLENLFVPMYGQYDLTGRLISFFIRIIQLLFRGVLMLLWTMVSAFLLIGYYLLPAVVWSQIALTWMLLQS